MAEQERKLEELERGELIAALEESRYEISDDLNDLRDSLSVTRKVHRSYQQNLGIWLGVSALTGFLLARPLLRITRKEKSGSDKTRNLRVAGVLGGATGFLAKNMSKMVIPALRFALTSYLGRKVAPVIDEEISDET